MLQNRNPSPGARPIAAFMVGLLIVLGGLGLRLPVIDQPFHRNPESMGSYYAVMARNYLRYGIAETRGLPVQGVGRNEVDPLRVYPNHPPLIPLVVAGSFAVFGVGEWQTRLPFVLFTLGCTGLIYTMVRGAGGRASADGEGSCLPAAVAAGLFACIPLTLRYGGQADVVNAQLIFFVLLSVAAYLRLAAHPTAGRLGLLALAFVPGALTDWPAFFLVPVFGAHFLLRRPRRNWWWIGGFVLFAAAVFGLLYAYISLVTGDWGLIREQFLRRSIGWADDHERAYTWSSWLIDAGRHGIWGLSLPVVLLAGVWIVAVGLDWRRCSRLITMTRLLLLYGLVHVLVGRQGVLVHDWWWWPVVPGMCMAAGLAMSLLPARRWVRGGAMAVVAVVCLWQGWQTLRWFQDPGTVYGDNPHYTVLELGAAIRTAAGPDQAVMLVDHDPSPYVWFYGDRPILMDIWDLETFERRRVAGQADLPFGYVQPWTPPPVAIVIPRIYLSHVSDLAAYLEAQHPPIVLPDGLNEKFLAYELK